MHILYHLPFQRLVYSATVVLLLSFCFCSPPGKREKTVTVYIQPFTGIAEKDVNYVYNELSRVYPSIKIKPAISLPASAYYRPRNRYKADLLIEYLSSRTQDGEVTIGLTSKDISTRKDNHPDWGVMGYGFCPGNACIASTFRLAPRNRLSQFFKVSIHELGHTQGIRHCPVKSCFMRDAEGGNPTDEEVEFCETCRQKLVNKGWKFASESSQN